MHGADVAAARADILVVLTSYNDVRTVGAVARAAREGLSRFFRENDVQIALADGGSTDGTREAARDGAGPAALIEAEFPLPPGLDDMPYHGHPGRAAALRSTLQTAHDLGVKACAFLDAGLDSVEPDWIERLLTPVLTGGFDYVSPYYTRRADEGAITKGIVYPVFRALYGVRLRQPAAGEFGCSARLASRFLEQDFWDVDQAPMGIDLWLAVAAVCGDFRVCEAPLGHRGTAARDAPTDLSTTLAQVVGALFGDLEHRVDVWQRMRGSVPVPIVGAAPAVPVGAIHADVDGLIDSFRLGYRELREIWTWVLPPRTIVELRKLTETPSGLFRFDDRVWAGIVYDFAVAYSLRVLPRDHLLRSLTPLYTGWLASFVLEMRDATPDQVEARVELICASFEAEKRHLISRWRWPERLR